MSRYSVRPCNCGSGKPSEWQYDGQGIELTRTCDDCHKERMSRYRPEILSGYDQSDVDEPIEGDDDGWRGSTHDMVPTDSDY